MTERSFVDTNIFVYARDQSDPKKAKIAKKLIADLWEAKQLTISFQVISEFAAVMTGKLKAPPDLVYEDVKRFLSLDPLPLDNTVAYEGLRLYRQYQLSWWDSWIVAAAIVSGCQTIYSEDLNEGASYHGVGVVNPFG